MNYVQWFDKLSMDDVCTVGGKNASLGEMIRKLSSAGITVPNGFATTADAFRAFMRQDGLDEKINAMLVSLDVDDVDELARVGATIRELVIRNPLPGELDTAIRAAYQKMLDEDDGQISVAVRSSATAEDLPEASFAGQQETFLNVRGIDEVLTRIRQVFASLYNDRAISYRVHQGFEHAYVALSAGIQRMVRSDLGASGVMFSIDTESGFEDVVFITSSQGLGRVRRAGLGQPRRILCPQANPGRGSSRHNSPHSGQQADKDGVWRGCGRRDR